MSTLAEQEHQLLGVLTRLVNRTFAHARAAGVPAEVFDDVESIARSMAAALPTIGVGAGQLVGPFYDTTGLTRWQGVTDQALSEAVAAGTVIACQLDGGGWVYPTWQFADSRSTHPYLVTLWTTLRAAADPWTCALWLRSPQHELDERCAADWIAEGRPLKVPLELARVDAERWDGMKMENRT